MSALPATGSRLDSTPNSYFGLLDLHRHEALMVELDRAVTALDYDRARCNLSRFNPDLTREAASARVSESVLRVYQAEEPGRAVAGVDVNIMHFSTMIFSELARQMARALEEEIRPTSPARFYQSGRFWYPDAGYMGWHHNGNQPGFRIYCNHAREHERSFFRYLDPATDEVVTHWDQQGWNFRIFRTDAAPLWHCVYSETDRLSLGFKLAFK
ncbi:MAG: hypothetical protein KDJ14_13965 [Xanthomonadales bacterium]|nr:hypothetical protein [Xanthomonadales bacterium]